MNSDLNICRYIHIHMQAPNFIFCNIWFSWQKWLVSTPVKASDVLQSSLFCWCLLTFNILTLKNTFVKLRQLCLSKIQNDPFLNTCHTFRKAAFLISKRSHFQNGLGFEVSAVFVALFSRCWWLAALKCKASLVDTGSWLVSPSKASNFLLRDTFAK